MLLLKQNTTKIGQVYENIIKIDSDDNNNRE